MPETHKVALFVDKASQQWVVRDSGGKFWIIPSTEGAWDQRQPFIPTEDTELEPIPGHYIHMLQLPLDPKKGAL